MKEYIALAVLVTVVLMVVILTSWRQPMVWFKCIYSSGTSTVTMATSTATTTVTSQSTTTKAKTTKRKVGRRGF